MKTPKGKKTMGRAAAPKVSRKRETEHVSAQTENLPCELQPSEYDARAQQLASTNQELEQLASSKKEAVSALTAEQKRLESVRAQLTLTVKNRQELRPVQTETFKDYALGEMVTVRLDRGREVVRSRPLAPDERQTEIPAARKTGGEHVTDKPPKGEKGKKLTGQTRPNDVEKKDPPPRPE